MIHSPLHLGQVIHPTDEIYSRTWDVIVPQYGKTTTKDLTNLTKGLLTEYSHNHQFELAGWVFETTFTTNVYDRKFADLKQDDKLATITDGVLSRTHTISPAEILAWMDEPDVIIHSFEEVDDGRNGSRYRGAISFAKLVERDLIYPSRYDHTSYFFIVDALKHCRA